MRPTIYMNATLNILATEGEKNLLEEAEKKQNAFYASFSCPRCKHGELKRTAHPKPFIPDEPLPRSLLMCPSCEHVFDPHTGIDIKLGNPMLGYTRIGKEREEELPSRSCY